MMARGGSRETRRLREWGFNLENDNVKLAAGSRQQHPFSVLVFFPGDLKADNTQQHKSLARNGAVSPLKATRIWSDGCCNLQRHGLLSKEEAWRLVWLVLPSPLLLRGPHSLALIIITINL